MAVRASQVLDSLQQCHDWVRGGARPRAQFKIGSEYERLVIDRHGRCLPYEGEVGIRTLLERMCERFGWQPYFEAGRPIAVTRGQASISLEPGGQFELSGAAFATIGEMRAELWAHLAELRAVGEDLGVQACHVGMNPADSLDSVPKMPKGRYAIMRAVMPKVGSLGLHMMHLTCTVQANVDFTDAAEAAEMLRLGHLLSPVFIALFANSPIVEGKETGYASFRAHLWTDVDPARCDVRRFAHDPAATIDDYVEWVLDVPMYFLGGMHPDGSTRYEAPETPLTFRHFFDRGYHGRRPTLDDWELHVSTVFPDMRLKRYVEIRQCDLVPPEALPAMPALAKGLFYDAETRKRALALLRDGDTRIDRAALREAACRDALGARLGDVDVGEWCRDVLELARQGLEALAQVAPDPVALEALEPLRAIAAGEALPYHERLRRKWQAQPSLLALTDGW